MDLSTFTEYIQPELLVLIPVLYLVGMSLKKAEWLDDRHIPVTLTVIGALLSALYVYGMASFNTGHDVAIGIFTALVQGTLCAGGAVLANNIVKQETTKG